MKISDQQLALLAKTIRVLSAEAVQKANSGHPGMPMGAADYSAVMWSKFMRFNPKDPSWVGRDRFVLSAGHGSMLLYSLLHLFGFAMPMEQIKNFRQWGSITPGHPEFGLTPGVETTTGPLGQGVANGVGLALSAKMMAARYGELFNHRVFGIVSDGDLMEGVAAEGASLAAHLKLDNLIYIYDDNHISIGGSTEVCFTESVAKRFEAYGWFVQAVDGHNTTQISDALSKAVANRGKPSLICARTTIGLGSPNKAGKSSVHGEPLGEEELLATKKHLGWEYAEKFTIPAEVGALCCEVVGRCASEYEAWQGEYQAWRSKNAALAERFDAQQGRVIPAALRAELIAALKEPKKEATRNLSGVAIQVLAKHLPGFVGGSADLEPSTKTLIKDSKDVQAGAYDQRNLRFGVREHGMGALANGLAYTQAWIPYTATFLVFSDYMRPTLRLAALSHLQTLFIFTHDSFFLGEDGPTHQPIEHLQSLRLIPNLYCFRPADGIETGMAYLAAVGRKKGPSALLFTRQGLPALPGDAERRAEGALRGGYVVHGADVTSAVIVASGSEVWVALEAAKALEAQGKKLRVVSMPCMELFLEQDAGYRDSVIPPGARKISLEAGSTTGWERIVSSSSLRIGIDHFGASAPAEILAEKFGFLPHQVAEKVAGYL